jgi:predicted transcriptional regulator
MASEAFPELTRVELTIMKLLWKTGRLSAREVHERLQSTSDWAYSTTRTTLDRMVKKGLLAKKVFHGLNLYEPRISKPMGIAQLVRDFADRVLEVDPHTVVSLFSRSESLTAEEIEELTELLEKDERGARR